ncbi:hypothetical protein ALC56_00204, partial [Trachymyrmex septentrionalis]
SIHTNVHNYMDRSIVTWLLLARSICQWRNQDRKKCHHGIAEAKEKYFKLPCINLSMYMSIILKRVSTNDPSIAHAIIIYDEMVNVKNNSWQHECGN